MSHEIENENNLASTSNLTMDDLTKEETLPEVQENAIAAVQASIEQTAQENAVDEAAPYGRKADGTPKKKRGRKAGEKSQSQAKVEPQKAFNFGEKVEKAGGDIAAAIAELDSTEAATLASNFIEGLTVATISKQWMLEPKERDKNIEAWNKAFNYYGGVNLSPPLALVGNHMNIIVKRAFTDSETKNRMTLGWAWLKTKFKRRKRDDRQPDDMGA